MMGETSRRPPSSKAPRILLLLLWVAIALCQQQQDQLSDETFNDSDNNDA